MDKALYDSGMAMRRKVLGDEYVDRAVANTDDFNRKFQDLLNEFCWGAVWTDEDLKPRDRSLLNIGMIACLGRMHEFEAHFRGALRNGAHPEGTLRRAAPGRHLLRLPGRGRLPPRGQAGAGGGSQEGLSEENHPRSQHPSSGALGGRPASRGYWAFGVVLLS